MRKSTHYSLAFEREIHSFAERSYELISQNFPNKRVIIFFSGFSGISHGLFTYHHIVSKGDVSIAAAYIRKAFENCHGQSIEYIKPFSEDPHVAIFIDDFIDTGATREYCVERIKESFLVSEKTKFYSMTVEEKFLQLEVLKRNDYFFVDSVNLSNL